MNMSGVFGQQLDHVLSAMTDYVRLVLHPRQFIDKLEEEEPKENVRRLVFYTALATAYLMTLLALTGNFGAGYSPVVFPFVFASRSLLFFLLTLLFFPAAYLSARLLDKRPEPLVLLVFLTAIVTLVVALIATPVALFISSEAYELRMVSGLVAWLMPLFGALLFGLSLGRKRLRRLAAAVTFLLLISLTIVGISLVSAAHVFDGSALTVLERYSPFFDPVGHEAWELNTIIPENAHYSHVHEIQKEIHGIIRAVELAKASMADLSGPCDLGLLIGASQRCRRWNANSAESAAWLDSEIDSVSARIARAQFRGPRELLARQRNAITSLQTATTNIDSVCADEGHVVLSERLVRGTSPRMQRALDASDHSHTEVMASMRANTRYIEILTRLKRWNLSDLAPR